MSAMILSVPFRVLPNGNAATVLEGSTEENAERVAVIAQTIAGEYPMLDDFGIPDPTWFGVDAAGVQANLNRYGPDDVSIGGLDVEPAPDGLTSLVRLHFTDDNDQGADRG